MFLLALGCAAAPAPKRIEAWTVDSLVKVFPDDAAGANTLARPVCVVPRNGHGSIQIALRSAYAVPRIHVEARFGRGIQVQVRRVGYVPVGSNPPHTPREEVLRPAPGQFPDPLFEDFPFDLAADRTETLWITVHAPAKAKPGRRNASIAIISGEKRVARVRFEVRVAPVAVPAARTLNVTNWLYADQKRLARFYDVGSDEQRYWEVLGNIGRVLAEHRQNVILTPVFSLVQPVVNGDRITYDFSRLDRWVETFDKAGITVIEGGHLLGRASEYYSPVIVRAYVIEDGKAVVRSLEPTDPRAEQSFASFLPALHAHLKERGWLERYIQHIHDEPHGPETAIYEKYGKIIRKHLPGVPTIDAVGLKQDVKFLEEVTDIWVPVLGSFDSRQEKIAGHLRRGGQAWFYTCIEPQGRHLNRFIDLAPLKTRLLHWFNFRHGLTGYLHWGGNYWDAKPFENVQPIINNGRTLLPAGDGAIVYPDPPRNSVLSSIRLEQMREGIEEYEMLAEMAKKDPEKARGLAGRAIPNIDDYVRDVAVFRAIQAELLGW